MKIFSENLRISSLKTTQKKTKKNKQMDLLRYQK